MSSVGELLPRAEQIARLNDDLRKRRVGGRIMWTAGTASLAANPALLFAALSTFDAFDIDNAPHGERDFGHLELAGHDLLWKIDYYEPGLQYLSSDPANAEVTTRFLTVMLASEY